MVESPQKLEYEEIRFTGFQNKYEGILNGVYRAEKEKNHGRRVFKHVSAKDSLYLYYWDDRDGADQAGWWLSSEIGADAVWARCETTSEEPTLFGWKCPPASEASTTIKCDPVFPPVRIIYSKFDKDLDAIGDNMKTVEKYVNEAKNYSGFKGLKMHGPNGISKQWSLFQDCLADIKGPLKKAEVLIQDRRKELMKHMKDLERRTGDSDEQTKATGLDSRLSKYEKRLKEAAATKTELETRGNGSYELACKDSYKTEIQHNIALFKESAEKITKNLEGWFKLAPRFKSKNDDYWDDLKKSFSTAQKTLQDLPPVEIRSPSECSSSSSAASVAAKKKPSGTCTPIVLRKRSRSHRGNVSKKRSRGRSSSSSSSSKRRRCRSQGRRGQPGRSRGRRR